MTVRFFYIDESFDDERFCLSAIGIRHTEWRECFGRVKEHRQLLKEDFGIFMRNELHSREFVNGRGRISDTIIGKHQRSRIFEGLLRLVATLPKVMLINVCLETKGRKDVQLDAWDRLTNRIERTMLEFEKRELPLRGQLLAEVSSILPDARRALLETRLNHYSPVSVLIADQGREHEITRVLRKMSVFNPVPSMFGGWDDGKKTKNISVRRIVEDPVFKKSHQSYFIQLADAVAYSLLKRETTPTAHVRKYGIHRMFERALSGVCYKKASFSDPLGIVRK
jgi:hypothetical protein